ncbi:hypothetical protein WJX73_005754 [Symbiochloris irregularis]|uniref:RING-type E3 ubiquitin transferase n=1 Tax=Symbiochloris irregularis TaxID=706552 RepID=A0AAW1PSB3_9CHLO
MGLKSPSRARQRIVKMKFQHYLKSVDEDAPVALRGRFLNYKRLKKFIKYRARRVGLASRGTPVGINLYDLIKTSQREVAQMLQEQLDVVDETFLREAKTTISAFDALSTPKASAVSLFRSQAGKTTAAAQDHLLWRDTAERAGWALRYARINVLALRKILKKHDKVMKSYFGQELLQRFYRRESELHFLAGPLHAELAASQLTCPVCKGILFDPAALLCSHIVSRQQGPLGSGFFQGAAPLPHVHQLACRRFPDEWQQLVDRGTEAAAPEPGLRYLRLFRLSGSS